MFTPSRLTLARKRRGLTKLALADAIGVSDRMVSFYETGSKGPSPETLARIVATLRFPVQFFSGDDLDDSLLASASFRALRSMTAAQRDAAYAAGVLALHLGKWIGQRFLLPTPQIPDLRAFGLMDAAAQALRAEWKLGELPIRNMVHLLEARGVRVFSLPADSERVDAFSAWHGDIPYVFVNTSKTAERIRFDLAHELGHLALHQHGKPLGRRAEEEADAFAAAFLMPRGSVLAHGPRNPSLGIVVQHKKRWGVSAAALIHRLHAVGLASAWTYRGLYIELAKRGVTYEPEPMQREASQVLAKVLAALRADGLGYSAIARDLALSVEDLSALMFGLAIVPVRGSGRASGETTRGSGPLRLVE